MFLYIYMWLFLQAVFVYFSVVILHNEYHQLTLYFILWVTTHFMTINQLDLTDINLQVNSCHYKKKNIYDGLEWHSRSFLFRILAVKTADSFIWVVPCQYSVTRCISNLIIIIMYRMAPKTCCFVIIFPDDVFKRSCIIGYTQVHSISARVYWRQ